MILESDLSQYTSVGFIIPVVSSVAICILDIVSIVVLTKCIRISRQQKILTINLLFSDSTMHQIIITFILSITFIQDPTIKSVSVNVLTLLQGAIALIYIALVIVVAFDRLLAITFPHSYMTKMPHSNVKRIIIVIYLAAAILIVGIGVFTPLYCLNELATCQTDMTTAFRPAQVVQISLLILADISVISAGVYFFKVAKEHAPRLRSRSPSTRINTIATARRIIIHVGAFMFMFSAALIFMALKDIAHFNLGRRIELIARTLTYVCILTNSIVALYFYAFIRPEFKLICRHIFCRWNNNFTADYERSRIEIYNISTHASNLDDTL